MIDDVHKSVAWFFRVSANRGYRFFNEAEMQHELACWLRERLPGYRVYFERPYHSFFRSTYNLVKTEIDLVISSLDHKHHVAIELKCPRNKQTPDTMYEACRDLRFLEELTEIGFQGGIFGMHVNHRTFHQESRVASTGIYSHFRAGKPLQGTILPPTKHKNPKGPEEITLAGIYNVHWQSFRTDEYYWVQAIRGVQSGA